MLTRVTRILLLVLLLLSLSLLPSSSLSTVPVPTMSSANSDRTIAITGCNRGIGLGLVRNLVQHGNTVIAFSRAPYSQELIDISSSSSNGSSGKCLIVELDVSSSSSHANALKVLTDKGISRLDAIIANAGIASKDHPEDPVMYCSEDDMTDLYRTNVIGTMLTLQSFVPLLCDKGVCVVMSSRLASIEQCVGLGGYLSYRCSKAALNMLAQTFAEDPMLKQRGIKMLCMHPGWVQTDMGGRNGRKAPVEIVDSVNGITSVLAVAMSLQTNTDTTTTTTTTSTYTSDSSDSRKEMIAAFSEKFMANNLVFTGFDFELLPF